MKIEKNKVIENYWHDVLKKLTPNAKKIITSQGMHTLQKIPKEDLIELVYELRNSLRMTLKEYKQEAIQENNELIWEYQKKQANQKEGDNRV